MLLSCGLLMLVYSQSYIGNTKPFSKTAVPAYSIANDTLRRSSADVTHVAVTGLGMMGVKTDLAQRPQVRQSL